MFKQGLSQETLSTLALLGKEKFFKRTYLAGGTALALQLGHRQSFDLDFYTQEKFNEDRLVKRLKKLGNFKETGIDWQTVLGDFPQVKFSIFYYEYPLIEKTKDFLGINIASLKDIAAMKLEAVAGRGTKRDFIDLYFLLCHKYSLKEMLIMYNKKYKNLKNLFPHLMKSLIYFEDAENEEMRPMLKPCNWEEVKKYFLSQVPKVLDAELKKIN